jgi:hypothetical protein
MQTMARWFFGTLILVVGVGAADRPSACGDKYLNLGLGTHYHRSPAERRAAAVLVYASAGSELSKLLAALSVEDAMKKVGYQPAIASSGAQLDAALSSRKWDVIVVDSSDMPSVSLRVQKTAGAAHLVPVLTRPTKDQLKQAEKTYDTVINTPSRNRVFVDVVDEAMDLHEIEIEAAARAARRAAR